MYIKQKDSYQFKVNCYYPLDTFKKNNNFSHLRMFFLYSFGFIKEIGIIQFIQMLNTTYKDGIMFELVDINIDNNLIYLSETYDDYCNKPTTPKIQKLLDDEKFINLCDIGFIDCNIIIKENFIHLISAWNDLLDQQPPFALLYQDEKDWFDVKPFDTQEAMEQFVADHTQK